MRARIFAALTSPTTSLFPANRLPFYRVPRETLPFARHSRDPSKLKRVARREIESFWPNGTIRSTKVLAKRCVSGRNSTFEDRSDRQKLARNCPGLSSMVVGIPAIVVKLSYVQTTCSYGVDICVYPYLDRSRNRSRCESWLVQGAAVCSILLMPSRFLVSYGVHFGIVALRGTRLSFSVSSWL